MLSTVLVGLFTAFSLLIVGMVRRRKTSTALAPLHPIRKGFLEVIRKKPGIRFTALINETGANRGTGHYHLGVLERVGAIHTIRGDQSARYFPVDLDRGDAPLMAVLMQGRVRELVQTILEDPGIKQHDLTKALGMSRRVVGKYAKLLVNKNLVREEPAARTKRYFPTDQLGRIIKDLERAEAASSAPPSGARGGTGP